MQNKQLIKIKAYDCTKSSHTNSFAVCLCTCKNLPYLTQLLSYNFSKTFKSKINDYNNNKITNVRTTKTWLSPAAKN